MGGVGCRLDGTAFSRVNTRIEYKVEEKRERKRERKRKRERERKGRISKVRYSFMGHIWGLVGIRILQVLAVVDPSSP